MFNNLYDCIYMTQTRLAIVFATVHGSMPLAHNVTSNGRWVGTKSLQSFEIPDNMEVRHIAATKCGVCNFTNGKNIYNTYTAFKQSLK